MAVLPYGLILFALVGWQVVRHARSDASERSKKVVAGLTAAALILLVVWPAGFVFAALLLLGVGVYVVLYRDLSSPGG